MFAAELRTRKFPWVRDVVPAYNTVLVHILPLHIEYFSARNELANIASSLSFLDASEDKVKPTVTLPVLYGGKHTDMLQVCQTTGLTETEVISLHTAVPFFVYAVGFSPGFMYLGELPSKLCIPRKKTPRLSVPPGAVAIAERQTAVYPSSSPGGWHIIGHCNTPLFNPCREPHMVATIGDTVSFVAVSK